MIRLPIIVFLMQEAPSFSEECILRVRDDSFIPMFMIIMIREIIQRTEATKVIRIAQSCMPMLQSNSWRVIQQSRNHFYVMSHLHPLMILERPLPYLRTDIDLTTYRYLQIFYQSTHLIMAIYVFGMNYYFRIHVLKVR